MSYFQGFHDVDPFPSRDSAIDDLIQKINRGLININSLNSEDQKAVFRRVSQFLPRYR